jgi:hypothetical protein
MAKSKRISIYNLTDVQARPTPLKMFRQFIAPGGKMIVPVSKLKTRSEQKRLARLQESRSIFVGDAPPAWYVNAKKMAKLERRQAQAYAPLEAPAPEPEAPATVCRDDVMKVLRKRTKGDLAALAELLGRPDVTEEMTKAKMLTTLEAGMDEVMPLTAPLEKYLEG